MAHEACTCTHACKRPGIDLASRAVAAL
jgi:hypothetical protein